MEKIENCRFCGKHAVIDNDACDDDGAYGVEPNAYRVMCYNDVECCVSGPWRKTKIGAIKAWNLMMEKHEKQKNLDNQVEVLINRW